MLSAKRGLRALLRLKGSRNSRDDGKTGLGWRQTGLLAGTLSKENETTYSQYLAK